MQPWLTTLFGEGSQLTWQQMSCRAIVCFFLILAMIRVSGRRSFGQHSPFDACVTVLLGAVLSRAVVGASPFLAATSASFAIVLLHRITAMLSTRWVLIDRWVNGRPRVLVINGIKDSLQMNRALVTDADLIQALREAASIEKFERVHKAVLERNGNISVLLR